MSLDRALPPPTSRRLQGERGDVVLGWLTRVIVLLVGFGIIGFDAIAIGTGHFIAEDHAQQAARQAARTYEESKDLQTAYVAALDEVAASGDTIEPTAFTISPEGAVTLTLDHESMTLLAGDIGFLTQHTRASRTVTVAPAR
jgi:hypothetical protein